MLKKRKVEEELDVCLAEFSRTNGKESCFNRGSRSVPLGPVIRCGECCADGGSTQSMGQTFV